MSRQCGADEQRQHPFSEIRPSGCARDDVEREGPEGEVAQQTEQTFCRQFLNELVVRIVEDRHVRTQSGGVQAGDHDVVLRSPTEYRFVDKSFQPYLPARQAFPNAFGVVRERT